MPLAHAASLHNLGGRNYECISKLINLCRAQDAHRKWRGIIGSQKPQWPREPHPESPRMIFSWLHLSRAARMSVQEVSKLTLRIEIRFSFTKHNYCLRSGSLPNLLLTWCILRFGSACVFYAMIRQLNIGKIRSLTVN